MCALKLKRLFALGLVAVYGLTWSTSVLAVGTDAGTPIINEATVGYKVGGVDQTAITSPQTTFLVDQVVDFTVAEADGGNTNVGSGEQDAVARFTVTNTGNATQDFALSVADLVGGSVFSPDTIDTTGLTIFVDVDDNDVYDAGIDIATFIEDLIADDTAGANEISVFVLGDIPAATDGDAANIELTATAYKVDVAGALGTIEAETGGNDGQGSVEIIFSAAVDSGATATAAGQDGYLVGLASLSADKASTVISDPLGQAAPLALAIPDAIVEYEITITNGGILPATQLVITDDIPTDLTLVTTGVYAGEDIQITKRDGTIVTCTADPTGDSDGCGLTGNTLTVSIPVVVDPNGISVLALADAPQNVVVIKFQATIN